MPRRASRKRWNEPDDRVRRDLAWQLLRALGFIALAAMLYGNLLTAVALLTAPDAPPERPVANGSHAQDDAPPKAAFWTPPETAHDRLRSSPTAFEPHAVPFWDKSMGSDSSDADSNGSIERPRNRGRFVGRSEPRRQGSSIGL